MVQQLIPVIAKCLIEIRIVIRIVICVKNQGNIFRYSRLRRCRLRNLRGRCSRSAAVWADSVGVQMGRVTTAVIMIASKTALVLIIPVPTIAVSPSAVGLCHDQAGSLQKCLGDTQAQCQGCYECCWFSFVHGSSPRFCITLIPRSILRRGVVYVFIIRPLRRIVNPFFE